MGWVKREPLQIKEERNWRKREGSQPGHDVAEGGNVCPSFGKTDVFREGKKSLS